MSKSTHFTGQPTRNANEKELVVLIDSAIVFEKDEIKHTSRRNEYWKEKKKQATVLLTNNFDLDPDEIIEIYRRR